MKPKTLILKTAGINCDVELAHGFELAGADAEIVHINELVRGDKSILHYDIIGFPGGFSYGDDLSAGRVLATEVIANLLDDLFEFYKRDGLIIGICNGFQTLVKAGILPCLLDISEKYDRLPEATLFWNDSGKFEDRWVTLKVEEDSKCVWTRGYEGMIEFPVAHAEGKFIPASVEILDSLARNDQIVFRYCDPGHPGSCETEQVPYPLNPNGSIANIAGVCDPTGRVLGLMPHPERFLHPENHPRHTRGASSPHGRSFADADRRYHIGVGEGGGWADGLPMFVNAVNYVLDKKGVRASR